MIDKLLYKFFGWLDDVVSSIETYAVKLTSSLWHTRVKLLQKKRKKKNATIKTL